MQTIHRSTSLLSEAAQEGRFQLRNTLTVWDEQASTQERGLVLYQMHPADRSQWPACESSFCKGFTSFSSVLLKIFLLK